MDPRLARTQYAAQAASLADQFTLAMQKYAVSGHRVEMTAPETSTAGGVQSLQHIRLVPPPSQAGGRSCVIGNANRATKTAEIRTLDYLDQVSLDRFGERTGFDPGQYAALVAATGQFLEMFGLRVVHASHAVSLRPPPAQVPAKGGFSPLVVVVVIIWSIAVLAIGLVVGVIATRGKLGH
jgi:hypothetical protein